ncbi:BQ2448_3185 [Microbotryum intermedium]|uniref:COX assembly mitochondrial protein n=1 Tax=Microbotryum intermedium TaxID=269621 RepID=A0A238FEG6_9BASI|nr:BQ2448_3185 [Microbotryum intermedium]
MHPPLAEHQHQGKSERTAVSYRSSRREFSNSCAQKKGCAEFIEAIKHCHDQHTVLKFIGYCNDHKTALNMCLRTERMERAVKNRQHAKLKRQLIQQRWDQIERES